MGPAWEQISGADREDGEKESRDSGNLIGSLDTKASTGFSKVEPTHVYVLSIGVVMLGNGVQDPILC